MTHYTSELIENEVLLAMDSNSLLDVEMAVQKICPLCRKDGVNDEQVRTALINAAMHRGAGIILARAR